MENAYTFFAFIIACVIDEPGDEATDYVLYISCEWNSKCCSDISQEITHTVR